MYFFLLTMSFLEEVQARLDFGLFNLKWEEVMKVVCVLTRWKPEIPTPLWLRFYCYKCVVCKESRKHY